MPLLSRLALGVELGGRAETAIGRTRLEQASGVGLVARQVCGLVHDVLVPRQAEPAQSLVDGQRALLSAALAIGVFHAEQEQAAVVLGVKPIEKRCARDADVEVARGAGREAETRGGGHVRVEGRNWGQSKRAHLERWTRYGEG